MQYNAIQYNTLVQLELLARSCAHELFVMNFKDVSNATLYNFQWFEEKQQQIETLDLQLKKLHQSVEVLVVHRKGRCH